MKENLSKNIAITFLIEFLFGTVLISNEYTDSPAFTLWFFATFVINTIALFLLIRFRTRFYIPLALLCLVSIITPPVFIFSSLMRMQC